MIETPRSAALRSALAIVIALACLAPSAAQAQCDPMVTPMTCNTVGADGKGALGGGILGAEIGFMLNAIIVNAGVRELDEWWAWALFPAVFAAGGAVGGYYGLEDPNMQQGFPEVAVAVFAVSMALIVPTFVGVLVLTTYTPPPDTGDTHEGATGEEDAEEEEEAQTPTNEAAPEQEQPPAETPAPAEQPPAEPSEQSPQASARGRVLAGGPGLLRFDRGRVLLGVPMVHSADSYTREERAHVNLRPSTDVRIPLVSGVF